MIYIICNWITAEELWRGEASSAVDAFADAAASGAVVSILDDITVEHPEPAAAEPLLLGPAVVLLPSDEPVE